MLAVLSVAVLVVLAVLAVLGGCACPPRGVGGAELVQRK